MRTALVLAVVCASVATSFVVAGPHDPPRTEPVVVIAHVDTGINPYSRVFRDDGPLAFAHPSTYIPGYPADTPALHLHLDEVDFATAFAKDAAVWGDETTPSAIEVGQLYWIPGTRIVGAMRLLSFGGGASCPLTDVPPANALNVGCIDHPILDDHGHGTMTASRMAGAGTSLCGTCRIVSIEGLSGNAVDWIADAGWIDVQTNSWVDLVPPGANQAQDVVSGADPTGTLHDQVFGDATTPLVREAAARMPVFFASGNGAAYLGGVAPTPTYLLSTAPPGVILVGGHDNGKVTAWAGAPPHVVADAYGGLTGLHDSFGIAANPISCCTSAASPYAAGGAADLILAARAILSSSGTGVHDGVVARAPPGADVPRHGPLADGELTLAELKRILFRTADARPDEGPHDGLTQWVGTLPDAPPVDLVVKHGPGANPFCNGCWTLPVAWADVDGGLSAYATIGYGSIDPTTADLAGRVLIGYAAEPARADDDTQYETDQRVREIEFAAP